MLGAKHSQRPVEEENRFLVVVGRHLGYALKSRRVLAQYVDVFRRGLVCVEEVEPFGRFRDSEERYVVLYNAGAEAPVLRPVSCPSVFPGGQSCSASAYYQVVEPALVGDGSRDVDNRCA